MASYYFPRFSDAELLRQFSFPLFYQFLLPYREFLCSQYDIHLTDNSRKFPYQQLVGALALPDRRTPEPLLSALFYINALSTSAGTRRLATILKHHDRSPDFPLGDESYALYASLIDTEFLRSAHAELAIDESLETEMFYAKRSLSPDLSRQRLMTLEDEVNGWYDLKNKSEGIQLICCCTNMMAYFQLRFGKAFRRKDASLGNETNRDVSRPEHYVFLNCDILSGTLTISSKKLNDAHILAALFGRHLCGDANSFFRDEANPHYTLDPLREHGPDILICSDVDRLSHVALAEVDIILPGNHEQTLRSKTCLFNDWKFFAAQLEACQTVRQATFLMHIAGLGVPRRLTICTPRLSIFRRSDGVDQVYFQWLRNRKITK